MVAGKEKINSTTSLKVLCLKPLCIRAFLGFSVCLLVCFFVLVLLLFYIFFFFLFTLNVLYIYFIASGFVFLGAS